MTIPVQKDENGDDFLFTTGDMGKFVKSASIHCCARTGKPVVGRYRLKGTAKFTGGTSGDGSPTLAKDITSLDPTDIPAGVPWPKQLGDDPR
jgi:hypothetical protein